MSSSLYWKPVKKHSGSLSDQLKFAIRAYTGDDYINCVVDSSFIDFLRGLDIAGTEDASKLINLIEKHGEIKLKEES